MEELKWEQLETKGIFPEARGGCQLAMHGDVLFIIGGHSMVWDKAGERDRVFDDIWALHLGSLQVNILQKSTGDGAALSVDLSSPHESRRQALWEL